MTGTPVGDKLTDIKVVKPSDQRVSPPCRHFKSCGGCQLQHASDPFVADWKVDMVRQALSAHGLETVFKPIITSAPQSRRRATLAARRTKKDAMVGFHGRGSDVIVEIPDCKLLDLALMAALPVAQALAVIGTSRKAALAVTVTTSTEGLDVHVQHGKPLDGPLRQELAHLCDRMKLARLTWGDESIAMRAPPSQTFGSARVVPPSGTFLQATVEGEAALLQAVRDATQGAKTIADLFSGCGTFTFPLAQDAEVHAVEGDKEMVQALDHGWRMAKGLKPITTQARDLFRRPLMPDELKRFDAVVLDPPRAGAEAQVAELVESVVPCVAYVSCNPVSFARDAAVLKTAGYCLDWVQVVDQFRWSAHIELVARFTRSA